MVKVKISELTYQTFQELLAHDQLCLCYHSHTIEGQSQSLAVQKTTKSPKKAKAVKAKKVKTPKAK